MNWQEQLSQQSQIDHYSEKLLSKYPFKLPKHWESKLDSPAIKAQFLPNEKELDDTSGEDDPIGDLVHAKGGQIIHRYKNRALFAPTTVCPVNCRYCFRKNELNSNLDEFKHSLEQTKTYLDQHPEIDEMIFTGGDPLVLSDKKISDCLELFSYYKNIKFIRFHTRTPVIVPSRLTNEFLEMLKKFSHRFRVQFVVHINHLDEWSSKLHEKVQLFRKHDFEFLSQSVLLAGVNDNTEDLVNLMKQLSHSYIRPYYLHHPDQVKGAMHFYLPLERGRKIYAALRNELSGWQLPQYIVDIKGGAGKTQAYNPENFQYSGHLIDRNSQVITHSEPN